MPALSTFYGFGNSLAVVTRSERQWQNPLIEGVVPMALHLSTPHVVVPAWPPSLPATAFSTGYGHGATQPDVSLKQAAHTISRDLDAFGTYRPVFARQVHGARILDVDLAPPDEIADEYDTYHDCDGLCTKQDRAALIVRSADCVPVVLAAEDGSWGAALHAGWRGTLKNISARAVEVAAAGDVLPTALHAWIGPRIGGDVYEVSPDLAERFREAYGHLGAFIQGRLLDVGELNRLQLLDAGLHPEKIGLAPDCTFSNPTKFPSYRRDGGCQGQIHTVMVLRTGKPTGV